MDKIAALIQPLLEFSPDALIVVDDQGEMLFANATTRALFGYTKDQLVGRSVDMLVPSRYQLRHGAHIGGFMRNPTNREMGARLIDLFARRSDGSEFPAGIRLAPFREGGKTYVAAAIRDMTERRAINDALVAAREEADRANAAKTRFLATASHDLRQPLQAIRLLNASMLTLTRAVPQLHDLARSQEEAIDGATRLLNSLLDITRLESGAIEPQLAEVALSAIMSELALEFGPVATAKRLRLEICDSPIVLHTDRVLFTQLLQNIIANAVKYTEAGVVRITVNLEADAVALDIEDSGVGIPEDKLDRVFDEYYQVDPRGAQRSGVGLGLAIVREVARLLGYSVAVTSKLGSGTRIRVRIPLQRLAAHDATSLSAPASGTPVLDREPSSYPRRLILLEDNDAVRKATELFLSLEGFDIRSAATVSEAEVLLKEIHENDIFISDYQLDGPLTGLDILQELRTRERRHVPAILMSGDLQSMLRAVKADIPRCRFLSKPVDATALLAAIDELAAD